MLYWDKLLILLAEVEAVINTRPLTYVFEEFESGFVLTPTHFLTGNRDIIPFYTDEFKDDEDRDYYPRTDSVKELSEHWYKSQKQLDRFWESWKHDYLLSLRETLPLFHRNKSTQLSRQPRIGEVVLVRDDCTPRRAWKLAQIKELIFGKDGLIRSAKIQLPNRNIISRAINHLYPLEITSEVSEDIEKKSPSESSDDNLLNTRISSNRKAAIAACGKISRQLTEAATCLIFCSPRSVMASN